MKKMIIAVLMFVMAFTLAACGTTHEHSTHKTLYRDADGTARYIITEYIDGELVSRETGIVPEGSEP